MKSNVIAAARFCFLTPPNIHLSAKIQDEVAMPGRKPFMLFSKFGWRFGNNRYGDDSNNFLYILEVITEKQIPVYYRAQGKSRFWVNDTIHFCFVLPCSIFFQTSSDGLFRASVLHFLTGTFSNLAALSYLNNFTQR